MLNLNLSFIVTCCDNISLKFSEMKLIGILFVGILLLGLLVKFSINQNVFEIFFVIRSK
jgi:hypothetical protein